MSTTDPTTPTVPAWPAIVPQTPAVTPTVSQVAPYQPIVPVRVRGIIWWLSLLVAVLSIIAIGLSAIWWPTHTTSITATAGVATSAMLFLSGALGVAYVGKV